MEPNTNIPKPATATPRKPFFKDPNLQKQYDDEGFVVIDLLNEPEVAELLDFYQEVGSKYNGGYGFHISMDKDAGYAQKVSEKLMETFAKKTDAFFTDYQLFVASFVLKEPDNKAIVPPHQDWTFVDESQHTSATIWTPLVDVNTDNGALGVIKGSHRFFTFHRASPSPQFQTPFDKHVFTIFPYLHIIELKAGQALVFNNQTIHASPPNVTKQTRIAAGVGITHKNAQLRHYYMLPNTQPPKFELFEVEKSFMTSVNNAQLSSLYETGKKPEGLKSLGVVSNPIPDVDAETLKKMMEAAGNSMNWPFALKMAQLFNYSVNGSSNEPQATETSAAAPQTPEAFRQKYTPKRIVAEIKYKAAIYTPQNIVAEIKHRFQQSPAKSTGLVSAIVASVLALAALFFRIRKK